MIFYKDGILNRNKIKELYIKKHYNNDYVLIQKYKNESNIEFESFSHMLWHYYYHINDYPICKLESCNNINKRFINFKDGYKRCCTKNHEILLTRPSGIEHRKLNTLQKYGVEHTSQLKNVKNKMVETNLEKYGSTSPAGNSKILDKIKSTNLEKYGVEYPLQNEESYQKMIDTKIEKYGDENYNNREKYKNSNLEKYGVEHTSQLEKIKDKIKDKNSKDINYFKTKYHNLSILNIINETLEIFCDDCGKNYIISKNLLNQRIFKHKINPCINCVPINDSDSICENELIKFIKNNYKGKIIQSDRNEISPYELDIYLPELNLAIEFNGIYWHSELFKEKKYHLNKTEMCEEKGIHLIHIYEDDWKNKNKIIKSRIKNLIGKSNRIYARKCELKVINDSKICTQFLTENHMQDKIGSKIKLGLYHNNELVSLMLFGSLRKNLVQKGKDGCYEMLRFCNKLNTNVIAAASKLFKYFIKQYNPNEITSYADRSWLNSNHNLFTTLDFDFVHKTQVNYYYIINRIKKNRFGFRKDILMKEGFDGNKTEHQIMLDRNIFRIYDCGALKYIWKNN